ncbi:MAG: VWA domain-containing protein [Armatimonadota bacterium]
MRCALKTSLLCLVLLPLVVAGRAQEPAATAEQPVDVVICLDTSGSMSGLIESAKQRLWAVVNELATAEPTPYLRVGLIQYGNTGIPSETGWVEKKLDLTTDLDEVYNQLFVLTTNGGKEYVARAMTAAREQMAWSDDPKTLKIIFVCGNEPATQDPEIKIEDACKATVTDGIIADSIFCGPKATGEQTGWLTVAQLAEGRYAAIDQDSGVVEIATPMDRELAELSTRLNATYIAYGARGAYGAANQIAQDSNAAKVSASAAASRAVAKGGTQYRAAAWDLVDASREKDFDLAKIPDEQLPENMRKMTLAQRKAHIEKMAAERSKLQKQIAKLGRTRSDFIATEIKKRGLDDDQSLDAALRAAIREQAAKNGFRFAGE